MKVKFYCDSGANIHSRREEVLDTIEDLGLEEGEWEKLDDAEKESYLQNWMSGHLEYGWVDNP